MDRQIDKLRHSVGGKTLFIGLLVLILLIPLRMVESQIIERGDRAAEARREVAGTWGLGQTIGAPVLVIGFEYSRRLQGEPVRVRDEHYELPSALTIHARLQSQRLERGIYEVPVYTTVIGMSGSLSPPDLDESVDDLALRWDDAVLALPVSDPRSIRGPVRITVAGVTADFQPAGERVAGLGSQLIVPLTALDLASFDSPLEFSLTLSIGGTESLRFLPLGDATEVDVTADWPSPSFAGAFLPDQREVGNSGFTAAWNVSNLGRGYPATWQSSDGIGGPLGEQLRRSSFGVDLIVPVGVHEASLRAAKYGVLFVALTFLAYLLFELFTPLRLHPLQYLLVGFANVQFFLLLVALAEHIDFGLAYTCSALGSIGLIGGYSAAVLGAARRAAPVAVLLSAIYGFLYFTLRLEEFALLSGSLGLFVILAAVMYTTRHVDWRAICWADGASAASDPASRSA